MTKCVVTIRADRCVMHLNLPTFLDDSTQTNITKALRLLFTHCHEHEVNTETVRLLDGFIPDMVNERKRIWEQASREYQDGYRDPKMHRYTRKDAAKVRAINTKLLDAVRSAKRSYDKALKIQTIYATTREKHYL